MSKRKMTDMKKVFFYIVPLCCVLALSACSSDDEGTTGRDEGLARLATVTLMATPNGLGDNGYNDAAAEGVFAFGAGLGGAHPRQFGVRNDSTEQPRNALGQRQSRAALRERCRD